MTAQIMYPIEGVYNKSDPIDVSVIIPLYKSAKVVTEQVVRWCPENLRVEIIYVDDKCPEKSAAKVFQAWNKRLDKNKFRVKIVLSNVNNGFGRACNLGAYHATGKYLIFLNADTTTTPNWIEPMVEVLQNESVGIVGNLQIKECGQWHGTIDGAGSEWSWKYTNFVHIGRHIYEGELIDEPFHWDDAPKEILQPGEREMVTGCCFAIRKDLFDEVGGFDCRYRVGYWEDSELCMAVRDLGYKIMFEPRSVIFHKLSHAASGGHNFHHFNKEIFDNKWIASGRIDKMVKAPRKVPRTKISNIIVQRGAAHGDVLIATAILPAIKKQYPDAKIHFRTKCPHMLFGNPYIQNVLEMSQRLNHELLVDLDYAYEKRPTVNILKAYADEAGVSVDDCDPFLATQPVDIPSKDYAVFHVGQQYPNWVGRNWPQERYFEIADRLKDRFEIVSVGGSGDVLVPDSVDMRGKTTMAQLGHVIQNSKLFVGMDSCPMHIAQTFRVPGVAFFGSISPETRIIRDNMIGVTADPTFLPCLGCHHRRFAPATETTVCETGHRECESRLTTDRMWEKVEQCLKT